MTILTRELASKLVEDQGLGVTIPRIYTSIGDEAFQELQLTSVIIPDSVTTIGKRAFAENQLTNIVIPYGVTTIGESAFLNNQLTNVVIPDSVKYLGVGRGAFFSNPLKSVVKPFYKQEGEGIPFGDPIPSNFLFDNVYPRGTEIITRKSNHPPFDLSILINVFDENIAGGALVAYLITSDLDSRDTHTYSLVAGTGDTDNSAFSVDGDKLKINAPPDFETQDSYSIRLQTKDAGGLTVQKIFVLTANYLKEEYADTSITSSSFDENIDTDSVLTRELASKLVEEQGLGVTIPRIYTSIGDGAFQNLQLTSVIIPDSVATIGESAFSNNQLTSIDIPDSVTLIGKGAFSNNLLTSIAIPDSITSIYRFTFYNNQLTSIAIPDNVTSIDSYSFSNNRLTSVDIPYSVVTIGDGAFSNNQLTSIDIPDSVSSIGDDAFSRNLLINIDIPDSVTSIGWDVFDQNPSINAISIDKYAQFNPYGRFPSKAKIIFRDEQNPPYDLLLTKTTFDENILAGSLVATLSSADPDSNENYIYTLVAGDGDTDNSAFSIDGNQLYIVHSPDYEIQRSYSIRIQTKDATNRTFEKAFRLSVNDLLDVIYHLQAQEIIDNQGSDVVLPYGYRSIGNNSFNGKQLTSITIPIGYDSTGNYSFPYNQITSVVISDTVTSIGDGAFLNNRLTTIDIPDSVTSIGAAAFSKNQLTSIDFPDVLTSIGSNAFSNNQLTNVVIPDGVVTIGSNAFSNNRLTSISIPASVTSIGSGAFSNNQLTSVVIPDGVVTIGERAFYQHNAVEYVYIPDSVDTIGKEAFRSDERYQYGLLRLNSISIPLDATYDRSELLKSFTLVDRRGVNDSPAGLLISTRFFEENTADGSIVTILSSTDPDPGDTFTYSLVPGAGDIDNRVFTIEGDLLKIKASPDYETQDSYSVRIQTKDSGGLIFEQAFTLTVNDINEIPTALNISGISLDENIIGGSSVAFLTTSDEDASDTHAYALVSGDGSNDNDAFEIVNDQIIIKESPDFETQDSYNIRLKTTDSRGLTFEKSFTLTVNDLPEKNYDFNGDGKTTLEHDAIIGLRMMFGTFPGDALIDGAITPESAKSIIDIQALISDAIYDGFLDLDSDGIVSPFTDGLTLIEEIQQLQAASFSDQLA